MSTYPGTEIVKVSKTAQTGRDWSADLAKLQNLDVALTTLAKLIRRGRNVEPTWVYGSEITAPAAGTALVSKTVGTGKTGYVYGIFITAQEANDFKLNWKSGATSYSIRIAFAGKGSLMVTFEIPINEGLGADADSTISITNVNAGSAGTVYQAGILYAEV
jgi:phage-related tail protein